MGDRFDVGPADWSEGEKRAVRVNGRVLCVVHSGGRYYALNDTCPHRGASLADGVLGGTMLPSDPQEYVYGMEGCVIRCPWHGWEFDVRTGASLYGQGKIQVRTYEVSVVANRLIVST